MSQRREANSSKSDEIRVVATGDWHGSLPADLPAGDVLVVAGDLLPVWDHSLRYQERWTKHTLVPLLADLPYAHVVFVAGNHDFLFMQFGDELRAMLPDNVHYLVDESVTLDGIKFHGSPWSNRFGEWAFMLDETELAAKWALIADDTDVLIVHGPPFGACDLTVRWGNKNVGSKTLRERLVALRIPVLITGHIHEGYGTDRIGATVVENVSLMNEDYEPVQPARVLTVTRREAALTKPAGGVLEGWRWK